MRRVFDISKVFDMHATACATASMQQIEQNSCQHDNMQRTLFISWERLSSIRTDRPEGMCRTRTADSVLLTC